jgi:hypothetical protein
VFQVAGASAAAAVLKFMADSKAYIEQLWFFLLAPIALAVIFSRSLPQARLGHYLHDRIGELFAHCYFRHEHHCALIASEVATQLVGAPQKKRMLRHWKPQFLAFSRR